MNIDFIEAFIDEFCIHKVGNKVADEGCVLSSKTVDVESELKKLLTHYFLNSFKPQAYYHFCHSSNDLMLNEVFVYVNRIFENKNLLFEQSVYLAKHLYDQSVHPQIRAGEFYIVYFSNCLIDEEYVDAIGLFKSENKDTFLKVYPSSEGTFQVESQKGININKLDKGCLVFNLNKENGYIVSVVDKTRKGTEARYWVDDFLSITPLNDEYHNTQNIISLYQNYVKKELPKKIEISKAEQVQLLNDSLAFFKENEVFDLELFNKDVINQPNIIEDFKNYKSSYEKERDVSILDTFTISDIAVKKKARGLASVIKLDKNFQIFIHGDKEYLKKGYDEKTGLHYYQLFFKEEK